MYVSSGIMPCKAAMRIPHRVCCKASLNAFRRRCYIVSAGADAIITPEKHIAYKYDIGNRHRLGLRNHRQCECFVEAACMRSSLAFYGRRNGALMRKLCNVPIGLRGECYHASTDRCAYYPGKLDSSQVKRGPCIDACQECIGVT